MSWRVRVRRALPWIVVAAAGFLIAYLIMFLVVFPGDVVARDAPVPQVTGMAWDDAVRRLEDAGFKVGTGEQVYHAVAPRQTVLGQKPAAGTVTAMGERVLLDVSLGRRQATVPRVSGLAAREAQLALEREGFTVGEVVSEPSDRPRGIVLGAIPAEGATATLPASVRLRASAGPATIEMPELVGRPLPEARSMLEQLGLRAGPVQQDSTTGGISGTVVRQEPAGRAQVRSGSVVRLTVAP